MIHKRGFDSAWSARAFASSDIFELFRPCILALIIRLRHSTAYLLPEGCTVHRSVKKVRELKPRRKREPPPLHSLILLCGKQEASLSFCIRAVLHQSATAFFRPCKQDDRCDLLSCPHTCACTHTPTPEAVRASVACATCYMLPFV